MRQPLALALSLAVLAAPARAVAPAPVPTAFDAACAPAPADPGCAGALLCSAAERVAVACALAREIDDRYVFASVKPGLLAAAGRPGFEPERHLEGCIAAERARAREDDALRFYDRMRRCVAAFEDGHLVLSVPGGLPPVSLGVGLRLVSGGGVHVGVRSPALVRWLEAHGDPDAGGWLAPGTEVIAVDGVPALAAIDALGAYLPASSPAARRERAVDALSSRDFAYPASPVARLTLRRGGARRDVELPWWIAPGAERSAPAAAWLRATGVRTGGELEGGSPPDAAVDPAAGIARGVPAVSPEDARHLSTWRGDAGQLAARLGDATTADGTRYCYAQLLTLHTETLARAGGGARRPMVEVVAEHVRGCDARGLDLVLDLRQDDGGYISHATAIARLVAPPGAAPARGALLLRASDHNERVFRARVPPLGALRAAWSAARTQADEMLDAIVEARARGAELTPAFVDPPAGAVHGGFRGAVVALVAPTCMSACERLAAMIRARGAVLVGGATEGAGGSQQEAAGSPARWVDPRGRLAASIPSAAMGVLAGSAEVTVSAARFLRDLALENRPVAPDVPYETAPEDLTGGDQGWRAVAEGALRAARRAPPRAAAVPGAREVVARPRA